MKYSEWTDEYVKSCEQLTSCIEEARDLASRLSPDDNLIDCYGISFFIEILRHMASRVVFFSSLIFLIFQMENEKDRFIIQKQMKDTLESNNEFFDEVISYLRIREFNDYRCIDWERRAADAILGVKSILEVSIRLQE